MRLTRTVFVAVFILTALLVELSCGVQNYDISPVQSWGVNGPSTASQFGISVALGDVNGDSKADLLVGADQDDTIGLDHGRLFVYHGDGSTPFPGTSNTVYSEAAFAVNKQYEKHFGFKIITGDLNDDIFMDAAVSGAGSNILTVLYGSANGLVVTGTGQSLSPRVISPISTSISTSTYGAHFGFSLAIGHVNGDQLEDLLVGAPGAATNGIANLYTGATISGVRHINTGVNTHLRSSTLANFLGRNQMFGTAVAIGNFYGTDSASGCDDLALFAPGDDLLGSYKGTGAGVVYLLSGCGTYTKRQAYSPGIQGEMFGFSALSMKISPSSTYSNVVVGAPFSEYGGFYVLTGSNAGFITSPPPVKIGGIDLFGEFGFSLAFAGDLNKDGFNDILVGAPYAGGVGKVYAYFGMAGNTFQATPAWTLVGETTRSMFGFTVAGGSDLNSDTYPDVVVGAYCDHAGGVAWGSGLGRVMAYNSRVLTDVSIDVARSSGATVTSSANAVFTLTARCWGPATATSVVVSAILPSQVTYVSATSSDSFSCTHSAVTFTVTCTRASMASGASGVITLTVNVPGSVVGLIEVSASVESAIADTDASDNSDTDSVTASPIADVQFVTTTGSATVAAGSTVDVVFSMANSNGPSTSFQNTYTVDIPTHFTVATVTLSQGGWTQPNSSTLQVDFGVLTLGAAPTATVRFAVALAAPLGAVSFTSTVASPTDNNGANNAGTFTTTVVYSADLGGSLSTFPATLVAGRFVDFAVLVSSVGPSRAPNVVVTSTGDANTAYVSSTAPGTCSAVGLIVTCSLTDTLEPSSSVVVVHRFRVNPSLAAGQSVSHAFAITSSATDPVPANNAGSFNYVVTTRSDLSLVFSSAVGVVGATLPYTIDVKNVGPSDATGTVVTCTLEPTAGVFTYQSASASAGSCSFTSPTLTCNLGTVAESVTHQVSLFMNLLAGTTVSQTCSVTSTVSDPDSSNNAVTLVQTFGIDANRKLTVDRFPASGSVTAGTFVTVTLNLLNAGPAPMNDAVVTAVLPAGVSLSSSSPVSPTTCSLVGSTLTCSAASVAFLASLRSTFVFAVDSNFAGSSVNIAFTSSSSSPDPFPSDNSASISFPVDYVLDLVGQLVTSAASISGGDDLAHTITVTNLGPSSAAAVQIAVTLEHTVSPVTVTSGHTCTQGTVATTSATLLCTLSTLGPLTSTVLRLATTTGFPPEASTVTYSVAVSNSRPETTLANNGGSDTATVVVSSADVDVLLALTPAAPRALELITLSAFVGNLGPTGSNDVAGTFVLDSNFIFQSVSVSLGSCSHDGAPTGGTVTCALGVILARTSRTVSIVGSTSGTYSGGLTFTAHAASPSIVDPDMVNNDDSLVATVTRSVDLSVLFTLVPLPLSAGSDIILAMEGVSSGPSTATAVEVVTNLPSGVTDITTSGATCSVVGLVVTCSLGTLAPLQSVPYQIAFTVSPSVALNTALLFTATIDGFEDDPVPSNNELQSTLMSTVSTDLVVVVSQAPNPVPVGSSTSVVVSVTNAGPSETASGANLVCSLPAATGDVALVGGSLTTTHGTCSVAGTVLTCPLGTVVLAAPATVRFSLAVTKAASVAGPVAVSCTIASSTTDPNAGNNADSDSVAVSKDADLFVSIRRFPASGSITRGSFFTTSTSVLNGGPAPSFSVVYTTAIPTGLSVSSAPAHCSVVGSDLVCSVASPLDRYTTSVASVLWKVEEAAPASFTLTVSAASGPSPDPVLANNAASIVVSVVSSCDPAISFSISSDPVSVDQVVNFPCSLFNYGPSTMSSGTLTVDLEYITGAVGSVVGGSCSTAYPPGLDKAVITCTLPAVPVYSFLAVTVSGKVAFGFEGATLDASASLVAADDSDTGNNVQATTAFIRLAAADLNVAFTAAPLTVFAGEYASFTAFIANAGPDATSSVVLTATIPTALVAPDISSSRGTCSLVASALTCTIGTVAVGDSVQVSIVAVVADTYVGVVNVTVAVAGSVSDSNPANNGASAWVTSSINAEAELYTLVGPLPLVSGSSGQLSLFVSNAGPSQALGCVVTSTFSSELASFVGTGAAGTCVTAANVVTCTLGAGLLAGESTFFDVNFEVPGAIVAASLANTASLTCTTVDSDLTNNVVNENWPVQKGTDLQLFGSATPFPTAVIGSTVTYSFEVLNDGPAVATNVVLTCTRPVFSQMTLQTPLPNGCSTGGGSALTCTMASLGVSDEVTFDFVYDIAADVAFSAATTFSCVVDSTDVDELYPSSNDFAVNVAITNVASLALTTKAIPTGPVKAGTVVSLGVTVINNGPATAYDVEVVVAFPATYVTVVNDGGTACAVSSATTVTCTAATILPLKGLGLTLTFLVDPFAAAAVSSLDFDVSATSAAAGAAVLTRTETVPIHAEAQVKVAVSTATVVPAVETPIVWVATYTNVGPSATAGSSFSLILPDTTYQSHTVSPGATCTWAFVQVGEPFMDQLICLVDDMATGTIVLTVNSLVNANAELLTIYGNVSADSSTDTNLADNFASVARLVRATDADLDLDLTASSPAILGSQSVTVTTLVRNRGPDAATNVAVQISFPLAGSLVSLTSSDGALCFVDSGTCVYESLEFRETVRVTLVWRSPVTYTGPLDFEATANSADIADSIPANNVGTLSVACSVSADLLVDISGSPTSPPAGTSSFTTVVSVRNLGPSLATGVVTTITVPSNTATLVAASSTSGGFCTVTLPAGPGTTFTCSVGGDESLSVSSTAKFVLTYALEDDATVPSLTFTASVAAAEPDADPTNSNRVRVFPLSYSVNAGVSLAAQPFPSVASGTPVVYTLVISNAGPSVVQAPQGSGPLAVTVSLPIGAANPDLSLVYVTPANPTVVTCALQAPDLVDLLCSVSELAVGASTTVTFSLTATTADFAGDASVSVAVTTAPNDPSAVNNQATVVVTYDNEADVALNVRRFPTGVIHAGNAFSVPFTALNGGPALARNVVSTLTLPASKVSLSAYPSECTLTSPSLLTCSLGDLPANVAFSGTLRFSVAGSATSPVDLSFAVTSDTPDSELANNNPTLSVATDFLVDLDAELSISSSPISIGQVQKYSAEVRNKGPSTAADVWMTVEMEGVEAGSYSLATSVSGAGATSSLVCLTPVHQAGVRSGLLTVQCSMAALELFVVAEVEVTTRVAFAAENSITRSNMAVGSLSTYEADLSNNADNETVTVRSPEADVDILLTATPASTNYAGASEVFTVFIKNKRADPAANTVVTVTYPTSGATRGTVTATSPASCVPTVGVPEGSLTCSMGVVERGVTLFISVPFTINDGFEGSLTVSASATTSVFESVVDNNQASASVNVSSVVDLGVELQVPSSSRLAGSSVAITATVSNYGPSPALATVFTLTVPVGLTFVSGTNRFSTCSTVGAPASSIVCSLGTMNKPGYGQLASAASGLLTFSSDRYLSSGNYTVSAVVTGSETDSDLTNNLFTSVFLDITGRSSDLFSVPVSPIPISVTQGFEFEFKFLVSTAGPQSSEDARLVAVPLVPESIGTMRFNVTNDAIECVYSEGNQTSSCSIGSVAVDTSEVVTFIIVTAGGFVGDFGLEVQAWSSTMDPVWTNNVANATTTIVQPVTAAIVPERDTTPETTAAWLAILIAILICLAVLIFLWWMGVFKKWKPEEKDADAVAPIEDSGAVPMPAFNFDLGGGGTGAAEGFMAPETDFANPLFDAMTSLMPIPELSAPAGAGAGAAAAAAAAAAAVVAPPPPPPSTPSLAPDSAAAVAPPAPSAPPVAISAADAFAAAEGAL